MKQSVVMSVLGDDTPGLVESLSKVIVAHQGEWIESRMAQLSGKFAGVLRINLPHNQLEAFEDAIVSEDIGLQVTFELSEEICSGEGGVSYQLDVIGQDQPGIIHQVSAALAGLGGNVEELHTEVIDASMSGEHLFKAQVNLRVPSNTSKEELCEKLSKIADQLVLDIDLEAL